ncbi:hypothetical protein V6N13_086180 [Hibiscus sabdariffa]|uniref:Uncharacterized protein n=1 Tax=Hibiscus sabdariffa TaxID=183260 RepID=A0ABR2FT44_9ROSI
MVASIANCIRSSVPPEAFSLRQRYRNFFALTSIKGIGRHFANIVCKKADVDMDKSQEGRSIVRGENGGDYKDGKYSQVVSMKLRDESERLKIKNHCGLRHYWGILLQHTNTVDHRSKTVGR